MNCYLDLQRSQSDSQNNQLLFDVELPEFITSNFKNSTEKNKDEEHSQKYNQSKLSGQKLNPNFKEFDNSEKCLKRCNPRSILLTDSFDEVDFTSKYARQELKNDQNNTEDKKSRNKEYSKLYRERQKQRTKVLEEENRYLKQKVQELSFRLRETEISLNRAKHANLIHETFETSKEKCIKEIQNLLNQKEQNQRELQQLTNKFKELMAFDSKQKIDLLNYHMTELLENIIDDMSFYFIDSLLSEKGLWKPHKENFRKIDLQVFDILELQTEQKRQKIRKEMNGMMFRVMQDFKRCWKQLYQNYLQLLNRGFMIQSLCKPIEEKMKSQIKDIKSLKLQCYFEQIKHRKDLRQIRKNWLKQLELDEQIFRKTCNKKVLVN